MTKSAYNKTYSYLTREANGEAVFLEYYNQLKDSDANFSAIEVLERLRNDDKFSDEDHDFLVEKYLNDKTYNEVGERIGIKNLNTLRTRNARILEKARKILAP